jgi:cytochrome c-type biogenesis protein CcmI
MSVLIPAVLLAIAVVFFVLYPVVAGKEAPTAPEDERLTEAQHRRRIALFSLRDVEYDYLSGKLDEPDYRQMKSELSREALAALDHEESEWRAGEAVRMGPDAASPSEAPGLPGGLEDEIATLRASIRDGMVCPQCGHPNPQGSRFCGDCGSAMPVLRSTGSS